MSQAADISKFSPARPVRLTEVKAWDSETDVIVVGFGGAGACAAIEAADAGAQVTLFELSSASGGSTAMSSGEVYLGGNGGTRVQKATGFEDSTENFYNFLMACHGPQADEKKVRLFAERGVEHFNWLVDHGVPFKDSFLDKRAIMAVTDDGLIYTGNEKAWPFTKVAKPVPRGHNLYVMGDNGGPLLMKILTENVQQRKNITVKFDARALTLIVDEQNRVHGLVVRIDMKEQFVRAHKGVVLCAGGFIMNKEMVQKYAPKLMRGNIPIGNPGDTGSGIQMGISVGASAINMHEGFLSIPFYPPSSFTYGIFVNSMGVRFINEDCYHGRVGTYALQQPGDRIFLIIGAEDYGNLERKPFFNGDIVATGETPEELEQELGMPANSIAHTIRFYSEHAAKGEDPLFHKSSAWLKEIKPPFVAIDATPERGAIVPCFTLGGLDTLPTGEVLRSDGSVIEGLYAAGRTSAGVPRRGDGYGSGMSVADVTFFGRLAGKQAAGAKAR
jgi:succinate dehydrogenase/fumarate reductase flavoprotein subunit